MISETEVLENYKRTLQKINRQIENYNRNKSEITIIGASKKMPIERIEFVDKNTDIHIFGENQVQEFLTKYNQNYKWHFIGQLQTNKVKYIIDKVSLIHSLDRIKLAKEINKQAIKHNIIANTLVELNIADEESKGGIKPDDLFDFIADLKSFENIRVLGLMAVMPSVTGNELENYYIKLNELYNKAQKDCKQYKNTFIRYLSAGMSNDFETAIKYGANIIRLGRTIFGDR